MAQFQGDYIKERADSKLFCIHKLPCYRLLTISFKFSGSSLTSPHTSRSCHGVADKPGVAGWIPGFTSLLNETSAVAQFQYDRSCWLDILSTTHTSKGRHCM